jgi:membrane associated rhomboid family serine protease
MLPLHDNIPSTSRPVVMLGLIAINVLVFLYQMLLPQEALEQFILNYALIPAHFLQAPPLSWERWQPVLTSMFLHGGILHIAGNMWYLWLFGDNVEDAMGHVRFLLLYLLCGAAAAVAHVMFNPTSLIPTVGASGAISGVMGAYLMLFPHARIITLVPLGFFSTAIEVRAWFFLVFWALLQFLNATMLAQEGVGGVAWWAHLGGFIAGAILGPVLRRPSYRLPRMSKW